MKPYDYRITAVRYEGDEYSRHIIEVKAIASHAGILPSNDQGLPHSANRAIRISRADVVNLMNGGQGKTFATLPTDKATGQFKPEAGAEVHPVERGSGEVFISTDRNESKADNLGELPEY